MKNQVNGIASSQEVLRAHGLLVVEAQTKGVEPSRISDWRERGQVAAQLIQEGRYEEATRAVEALNAEMRAELKKTWGQVVNLEFSDNNSRFTT